MAAICLGLALTGLVAVLWRAPTPAAREGRPRTLAILPFRNLQPNPDWDFLGLSLADAIIGKLAVVPHLTVRPSSYVARYRGQQVDPQTAARELDVDTVLAGSFVKEGDDLRVSAELVDVGRGSVLWQESFDLKYDRLMTLQDRVSERILEGLRVPLSGEEARRLRQTPPSDVLAYEYYLRGIDLNHRHAWRPAIPLLTESVSRDGTNAAAWTELGEALYGYGAFQGGGPVYIERGIAAMRKALEIDPDLLEPRIALVMYYSESGELERAMPLLHEILRINSNFAPAHWWSSQVHRYAGLLDESLQSAARARQLDPNVTQGFTQNTYLYAGRVDDFLRSLPDDGSARTTFYRGLGSLYQQDATRAAAEFDTAFEMDPTLLHARIGRAMRLALDNRRAEGMKLLTSIDANAIADGEMLYKIAQAYAMLGDAQTAVRLLGQAVEQDFFCYPYIARDALLANAKTEPRFAVVLARAQQRSAEFRQTFSAEITSR